MNYSYILFDLFVFFISTFSVLFFPNGIFPHIKRAIISIGIVSSFFLLWDYLVTDIWWYFNSDFLLGVSIGKLPIEEILFFIVIPWSCLIIWVNLKQKINGLYPFPLELLMLSLSSVGLVLSYLSQQWYTVVVCLLSLMLIIMSLFLNNFFRQRVSVIFLFLLTLLIIIFDSYLTFLPIVKYNHLYVSGFFLGNVPIEDIIYGLILIFSTCMLYESKIHPIILTPPKSEYSNVW